MFPCSFAFYFFSLLLLFSSFSLLLGRREKGKRERGRTNKEEAEHKNSKSKWNISKLTPYKIGGKMKQFAERGIGLSVVETAINIY